MSYDTDFLRFHYSNPKMFCLFVKFAREAKDAGFKQYSARAIAQRIRWHSNIETRSRDGFKLSNNHIARYARLLIQTYPDEFTDFFVLKKVKSSLFGENKNGAKLPL